MRGLKSQRGGVYGVMFVLAVLGIATLVTLKALPVYLNQMKVASAVGQIVESPQYTSASVYDIRKDLQSRWDVEDITHLKVRDLKIVKVQGGRALQYDYEVRTTLFKNWDLVIWFKDEQLITGRGR